MENNRFREAVAIIITTGGTIAIMPNSEQIIMVVITGFLVLFTLFAWPEYEEIEQIYNPAQEPEKVSQWEKIKEGFLKAGWKVRKVRRRKQ